MHASKKKKPSPSFSGLTPASSKASRIASKASRKTGTRCEVKLRRPLRKLGLKFKTNVATLPGCPDFVFEHEKVVVFADGDFWHGRQLAKRIQKLSKGHNKKYWIQKIRSNVTRDRRVRRQLMTQGWRVIRVWESDIHRRTNQVAGRIVKAVKGAS